MRRNKRDVMKTRKRIKTRDKKIITPWMEGGERIRERGREGKGSTEGRKRNGR